jgi:hypothetical protein
VSRKVVPIKTRSTREADARMPARPHAGTPADAKPGPGYVVRRNGTRKKTVYLPEDLCRALRMYCAANDTDETKTVVAALKAFLGQE